MTDTKSKTRSWPWPTLGLAALLGYPAGALAAAAPTVVAIGAPAAILSWFAPPGVLLGASVVLGHGLGTTSGRLAVFGSLLITDLILLVWLARNFGQIRTPIRMFGATGAFLIGFLAWSFLASLHVGASITPLLRLSVYAAVLIGISMYGLRKQQVYVVVLIYALVNIVAGIFLKQSRLTGFDIGDPAQMGGVVLAALCPILTRELVFRGRWLVFSVLLFGIWMTQTRSVWFATLVLLAVWIQKTVTVKRVFLTLISLGAVGFASVGAISRSLGLNESSGTYRLESITNGLHSGLANPLFGNGWARTSIVDAFGSSHLDTSQSVVPYNLFVNIFTSVGLPGLFLFVGFLLFLLRNIAPARRAPLLFCVAVLAMSLTEMTIYAGSTLTLLFFIYAGIGFGELAARRAGGSLKGKPHLVQLTVRAPDRSESFPALRD